MITVHLVIVIVSFYSSAFILQVASQDKGAMQVFLWFVSLFLILFGYVHAVPVFFWPCGITVDRHAGTIIFCYLLFKRTIALERLERCVVTEVLNREHYPTYLLFTKSGKVITLSDLTISRFPGSFANNIAMEVDDRLPRFIPGFRWLFHKR